MESHFVKNYCNTLHALEREIVCLTEHPCTSAEEGKNKNKRYKKKIE